MLVYLNLLKGGTDLKTAFDAGVRAVASRLGVNPNWLTLIFYMESGMNPKAVNSLSNATGLIQFMPATARILGTTVEALRKMSAVEQLRYVEAYFSKFKGHYRSFPDLYLAAFYPKALLENWPDSRAFSRSVFQYNRALDLNGDGTITVGEFKARAMSKVPKDFPVSELKKKSSEVPEPSLQLSASPSSSDTGTITENVA